MFKSKDLFRGIIMEILFEEESSSMNEALLERVNPAYKTAATTLSGLAAGANDEDARALTEKNAYF